MRAGLSLGLSFACAAGAVWSLSRADAPQGEGLTAEVASRDLGPVRQGGTGHGTFRLRNDFPSPIEITAIAPTCGCTAAVAGKRRLEPGEATDLKCDLHVGDTRGRRITRIDVGYRPVIEGVPADAPPSGGLQTLTLELTADVKPHYEVRPATLTFRPGDRVQELRLTPNFEPGVKIKAANCPHPAFKVEVLPAPGGEASRVVRVRFDPSRWEGDLSRPRIALSTSSPYQARHEVGVTVMPADPLVASEESNDVRELAAESGR